jgi:hypothetical protein
VIGALLRCIVVLSASEERHAGHLSEPGGELVLKDWVFHFLGRGLRSAVMPVSAADRCRGIVAHGKPSLREIPLFEIVRRTRPAHFRRNPPGIDGIAQHVGPAPCDRERECRQIELATLVNIAQWSLMRVATFRSRRQSDRGEAQRVVYQFLIVLSHTQPLVWRRIQVPQSYSFWDLHVAIQDAMGWQDRHLHEFRLFNEQTQRRISIGIPTDMTPGDRPVVPGWTVAVSTFVESRAWHGLAMLYAYDFGDDWEHALVYEGAQPVKRSAKYPRCLAGARRCPPEDCGGAHGYAQLLEILADPDHAQHASMRDWTGDGFDPDAFDPRRVVFDDPQKRWSVAFER